MRIVTHIAAVVAANLRTLVVAIATLAAGLLMAGQALGFTCLNRDDLADVMQVSGGALIDEFVEDDGKVALNALNMFTLPETLLTGEQVLLWQTGGVVQATIFLWRGGGYCLISQRVITSWQAEFIAQAVLGE